MVVDVAAACVASLVAAVWAVPALVRPAVGPLPSLLIVAPLGMTSVTKSVAYTS